MKLTYSPNWPRTHHVILFLILIVAFAIRFYHIGYDLPYVYDQDEPIFVTFALRMLKNMDLNPHWFGHPGTTLMYVLAGVYAVIFAVGWCLGTFQNAEEFRQLYYTDPTIFYKGGRIVCLVFGIATIWLVFMLGRRLHDPLTGLIAAGVVALSPLHILLSQLIRPDTEVTFFLVVGFWFCLDFLQKQDWKSYLLAGFITGVAVVTKYPAAVLTLTIAVAHFLAVGTWRPTRHVKLAASAAACLLGMFAGSPFVFLDFRTVIRDVITEARPEHLSATGEGLFLNILWYLQGPLPAAVSVSGLLLAGVGIVLCITSKKKGYWLLLTFPISFFIFISSLNLRWERWILPLVPFLALLLALAVTRLCELLKAHFTHRVAFAATATLLLMVLGPLLRGSIIYARATAGPYTSTLAREWMLTNLPAGSGVLVEVLGPPLPTEAFKVFVVDQDGTVIPAKDVGASNYLPGWDIGRIKDLSSVSAQGINYFVMTSFYQHFVNERNKYPSQAANYEQLMSSSILIHEVEALRGRNRGPRVRIYQLKQKPRDSISRYDAAGP